MSLNRSEHETSSTTTSVVKSLNVFNDDSNYKPPPSPLKRYLSRKFSDVITSNDLPVEKSERGILTPAGIFFFVIKLTVPIAYIYIVVILIRELCLQFNSFQYFIREYLPTLYSIVSKMTNISKFVEVWAIIEGLFYICLRLHLQWLQYKCPLELSLKAHYPLMDNQERQELFERILDAECDDPISYLTGWFFDVDLEKISRYDVLDFTAWAMFEGRNQEHLTLEEFTQLDYFVDLTEACISRQLYGESSGSSPETTFAFPTNTCDTHGTMFTNLCEQFNTMYEQYKAKMMEYAPDFHPVQDFYSYLSDTKHKIEDNLVANFSFLNKGASALAHATHDMHDALVSELNQSTKYLATRKKAVMQQLESYKMLLDNMRNVDYSHSIPSRHMADLMKKITQCNDAMHQIECSARDAFFKASGCFHWNNVTTAVREPLRYAKYSSDPILGVSMYPLIFHLTILLATDGSLRLWMLSQGFERLKIGKITYYYHPGKNDLWKSSEKPKNNTPIVFIHGIGIGIIYYLPLVQQLLKLGRPLFFPEIPYVTGFRTWFNPNAVLPPAAVSSTLNTMLATHGFLKASFVAHSFGTSWLSYMCKLSPNTIQSIIFLDPICFCLHAPFVTKNFVYQLPDPGSTSYCIRTDALIHWTIQRNFPWARISLFVEEMPSVPIFIFLSEKDAIVPTNRVHHYLTSKANYAMHDCGHNNVRKSGEGGNVFLFHGVGHGDWIGYSFMRDQIVQAVNNGV